MSVSEDSSTSEFEEFARTRLTGEPSFTASRVPELSFATSSQSPSPAPSTPSPLSFSSPTPTHQQKHPAVSSSSSSSSIGQLSSPTSSTSSPSLSSVPSSSPFSSSTPSFSALTSSTSASSFQPTRRGSSWIGGQQQKSSSSQTPLVSPRTSSSGSSWFSPIMALLSPRWLEDDTEADTKAAVASVSPRSELSPRVTPRLPEAGETFAYFEGVSWVAKLGSVDGIPIRLAIGENVSIFSPTGELMFAFQLRKIRQYGTKVRTFLVEHHQDDDDMRWIYLLAPTETEAHTMKATLRHAIQSAAKQMAAQ